MNGIIESVYHYATDGFNGGGIKSVYICGEDGVIYFGHKSNFTRKSKHYLKGRKVTFDIGSCDRAHPEALNVDVEVPDRPQRQDQLVSITHLTDGAYIKRIIKPDGKRRSLIIKDGELLMSVKPEYENDMLWIYRRGPSGENERAWEEHG